MRGNSNLQNPMFFVANTEERLAKNHPLRAVKQKRTNQTHHSTTDPEAPLARPSNNTVALGAAE